MLCAVRPWVRTAILIPYGIITVVAAFSWKYAFDLGTGFVGTWLNMPAFDWFGDFWSSFIVICAAEIWKTTPFMALLILAGLQMIPQDIYEAAKIDGINPVKVFFKVTLPLIKPALAVAVIFRALDALRVFDLIYVLTPNNSQTKTMSVFAQENLFQFDKFAYGSAASTLLFLVIGVITIVYLKLARVDLEGGR